MEYSKKCSSCRELKVSTDFSKDKTRKDGLAHKCKICHCNYQKSWTAKNYKHHRENQNNWQRTSRNIRLKTETNFKLAYYLRNRLNCALRNNQKVGSAVSDLGCSIEDFRLYIEAQFEPGMSWNNWNRYGWHLDHKIPLCTFELSDKKQFKKATHFTNLQPLWAKDNLVKGGHHE